MIRFHRLLPSHVEAFCLQDEQARFASLQASSEYREALAAGPVAWSCFHGDDVVGCGGIVPTWDAPHIGRAWALVGKNVPRAAWPAITAHTQETLATALAQFAAIETEVDLCHRNGHRWAHILGFRLTGVRPYRNPDTQMPAATYTYAGEADGLPVAVAAVLDFLDRCVASWLKHAPGTSPNTVLKAALPRPKLVRRAA